MRKQLFLNNAVSQMWRFTKASKVICRLRMPFMLVLTLLCLYRPAKADEYSRMRALYVAQVTGGPNIDTTDATIKSFLTSINANIATYRSRIPATITTYAFNDLKPFTEDTLSATLARIDVMAKAYATLSGPNYTNYHNAGLAADIVRTLNFVTNSWYCSAHPSTDFYGWQITMPRYINDILMLMYDSFTNAQIGTAYADINYFIPSTAVTGSTAAQGYNMTNMAHNLLLINILYTQAGQFTPTNTALQYIASQSLYPVDLQSQSVNGKLPIEGFASDGSFTSHRGIDYLNGTYCLGEMSILASVIDMISQSTAFKIPTDTLNNLYRRVFDTYQHLCYKGFGMPFNSGRFITHNGEDSQDDGLALVGSIVEISQHAPTSASWAQNFMYEAYPSNPKQAMLNLAYYWLHANGGAYTYTGIADRIRMKAFEAGSYAAPTTQTGHFNYPYMGKDSHITTSWASGISMYSSRNTNWEHDTKGLGYKGWHISDGMTYLFNADSLQYCDNYWPTVDLYRLPGTTAVYQSKTPAGSKSSEDWVGGSRLQSMGYGATGMSVNITDSASNTLRAKKSWFSFDSEIAALGAGIFVNNAVVVETYMEQRKLNSTGTNAYSINGTAQPTATGSSYPTSGVTWAYLTGNVTGSNIGYYFPTAVTLYSWRTKNTTTWSEIEYGGTTHVYPNYYQTMWISHGTHPTQAAPSSYAYVVLPNKTSTQVSTYAAHPDVTILRNDTIAQAVKKHSTNTIAVNFWNAGSVDTSGHPSFIQANGACSVITHQTATTIDVAVSDPTFKGTGEIWVTIDVSCSGHGTLNGVGIHSYNPLTVKLFPTGALGKTFTGTFTLGTAPMAIENPLTDTLVAKKDTVSAQKTTETPAVATADKPFDPVLYPNPASGTFNMAYYSTTEQPGQITIYDTNGAIKQTQAVQLAKGKNDVAVDVTSLKAGLYYVVLKNSKETVKKQLIIK